MAKEPAESGPFDLNQLVYFGLRAGAGRDAGRTRLRWNEEPPLLTISFGGQAIDDDLHVGDPLELRVEHRLQTGDQLLDVCETLGICFRRRLAIAAAEAE
ncbi:MAG TPA: hypothetical protein VFI56_06920 [Vicinamibacterales bacterium]|nr:hypothetical protein [Vicinamibacterales bacterium]